MIPACTASIIHSSRAAWRAARLTVNRSLDVNCTKAASNSSGTIIGITTNTITRYSGTNFSVSERLDNPSQLGSATLSNITYGAGMFAICGTNNLLLVSTDNGANWTTLTAPALFTAICIDSSGALVGTAVNKVWKLSSLSGSWVQTATLATSTGKELAYDTYRGTYLASQGSGSNYALYKSADAVTWTAVATGSVAEIKFAWNGDGCVYTSVASTVATIRQSADWTTGTLGATLTTNLVNGIGAAANGFIVSAQYGYYYSLNGGVTWASRTRTSTGGTGVGSYLFPMLVTTNNVITGFANGSSNVVTSTGSTGALTTSIAGVPPYGSPIGSGLAPVLSREPSSGVVFICGTGTSSQGPAWANDGTLDTITQYGQNITVVGPGMSTLGTNHVWVHTINDINGATYRSYTSTDQGQSWTAWQTTGNTTYAPQSMVSNGTISVIGVYGNIMSTSNGIVWTARSAGFTTPGTSRPYIVTNGSMFVALNRSNNVETSTSTDGMTWTKSAQTAMPNTALVWSGQYFVAIGTAGAIKTSTDGVTWTTRTSGTTRALTSVAADPATGTVVAVMAHAGAPDQQMNSVLTSVDGGLTWSTTSIGRTIGSASGVYWTGSQFVCVTTSSSSRLWLVSPDGINWSVKTDLVPPVGSGYKSLVKGLGDGDSLYGVTQGSPSPGSLVFNKISGKATNSPTVTQVSALSHATSSLVLPGGAFFITHNGKYYCAFPTGSAYTMIYSSTDVENWTQVASGAAGGNLATWQSSVGSMGSLAPVSLASAGSNLLLGVTNTSGVGCGIFRSTDDGVTWSRVFTPSVATIRTTPDGTAWAFPVSGGLQRSTDGGATWSSVISSTIITSGTVAAVSALNVVKAGAGYVLTVQGAVFSSADGAVWVARTYTGSNTITGCAVTNNAVVAVNANGATLAYSYDGGVTWSFTTNTVTGSVGCNAVWDGQMLYLGASATLYTVDF